MSKKANLHKNLVLHVEDESFWRDEVYKILHTSVACNEEFGGDFYRIESMIENKLSPSKLEREIARIEKEMQKADDAPVYLGIVSGQVARGILEKYMPSVMISDTAFPMNGKKTVDWLLSHDLGNYPLIGLSATLFGALELPIQAYYKTRNSTYMLKRDLVRESFAEIVIKNRKYVIENYRKGFK